MEHSPFLLKQREKPLGPVIRLQPGKSIVGREPRCEIFLPHPSVSRRHAEIVVSGMSVTARDLNSRNGTFVDDRRIQSSFVIPGQYVKFGTTSFLLTTSGTYLEDSHMNIDTVSGDDVVNSMVRATTEVPFSAAQQRVFNLMLEGLAEKQISERLEISQHTVHNHIRVIYRKMDVHSRSELLAKFLPRETEG